MKYLLIATVLVTFFPSLALAQNPQYTNCHSLELAGYVIGSDEVLVDGKVCKVVAPKTNSTSSTPGPATAAEKNKALLGIIEPEVLRIKEKTEANAPSGARPRAALATNTERSRALLGIVEPATLRTKEKTEAISAEVATAPRADIASNTNGSTASAVPQQPEAFETVSQGSLGEIAKAYRKNIATQTTQTVQAATAKVAKPSAAVENEVAVSAPTPAIGVAQAIAAPKAVGPFAAETARPTVKQGAAPVVATAPAAQTQRAESVQPVVATPTLAEAKPQAVQDSVTAAPLQSAPKTETTLPVVSATQPEVSSAPGAAEQPPILEPESERERAVKTGEFVAPKELLSPGGQPESAMDNDAEISAFREGQMPGCHKNISLGSMKKDNLFLAIPDWALGWYLKNQKKFSGICFSNALMPGARNYLVVFYTADPAASNAAAATKAPATAELTSVKGQGGFTTSYGAMWHYTYGKEVTTTITSVSPEKAPHNQDQTILYAMAYTEQGIPVARRWPAPVHEKVKRKESSKKPAKNHEQVDPALPVMTDLLGQMVEEIAKQ
jgi:hypothetical protein